MVPNIISEIVTPRCCSMVEPLFDLRMLLLICIATSSMKLVSLARLSRNIFVNVYVDASKGGVLRRGVSGFSRAEGGQTPSPHFLPKGEGKGIRCDCRRRPREISGWKRFRAISTRTLPWKYDHSIATDLKGDCAAAPLPSNCRRWAIPLLRSMLRIVCYVIRPCATKKIRIFHNLQSFSCLDQETDSTCLYIVKPISTLSAES